MANSIFLRHKWITLLSGIVIGLVIAAGFNWTRISHAKLANEGMSAPAPENPKPPSPDDVTAAIGLSNVFASVSAEVKERTTRT